MNVIARSDDWEIWYAYGRYSIVWRHESAPPEFIAVQGGYQYQLTGRKTHVVCSVAAMLTAWTGATLVDMSRATLQFRRYLASHRRRAEDSGITR